ncbi:MAG: DUF3857 domain-containing protein [Spirochaetes bacterium]|nr:DUF3857 domain-containing protein [Spirochaetota bacterium]
MLNRLIPYGLVAAALIQAAGPLPAALPGEEYFSQKKTGRYAEAVDSIRKSAAALDNPVDVEIHIFRIRELMLYPELYEPGLEALSALEQPAKKYGRFLLDRIDTVRNILFLKRGDLRAAEAIAKSFSFMEFRAMGPFANTSVDEFERSYPPESGYTPDQLCKGKFYTLSWFNAAPDRTGCIAFNDLFPDTGGSFFYLYRTIEVPSAGEYYLILGKTGYTDLWLDGTRLFSDRTQHGFDPDQYFIRVFLSKGTHRILIKTGDSDDGIRISMRMLTADGARIAAVPGAGQGKSGPAKLRGISFYPSLSALMKIKKPSPSELFTLGYLFSETGLGVAPDNRALQYLSAVPERHELYSSACYYIAKKAESAETRDHHLNKSIAADPENLEALRELACLKISRDFLYEAYPLIRSISRVHTRSPWLYECMARLFIKNSWTTEAYKQTAALAETPYPALGYRLEATLHRAEGDYHRAADDLERLIQIDNYDISLYQQLLSCLEHMGDYEASEQLLARAAALFPNAVAITLRLAVTIEMRRGPKAALPYLASAHARAPGNRNVLLALGTTYRKMGKRGLALHWLGLASLHDPENHELKRYLKVLGGGESDIERHAVRTSAPELAAAASAYRNEPAVVLLDENVISVNMDGSFERLVRKTVMVNTQSEIRNFNTRYIVVDPDTESVESLSCAVVRGLARTEISERYRKHLSDPDSRLYYNLEALVLPIATLAPGDIIDLRYIIKNRGGADYRNYFGEKIVIGGSLRTMISRTVLIHPADKPIYCHLKRIDRAALAVEKSDRRTVYRISIDNRAPYTKEQAMPNESEMLPAVYFTSHRTWNDFHAWYTSLLRNSIRVDGAMTNLLRTIITDRDRPLEKIRKIYAYVADEIRYVGFEFGVGGIRPRSSDTTFHTKMGDCKDKSLLLIALLRAAGIDARLALIRTRDKGTAYVSPAFAGEFNHAICHVNSGGGFFLDPTASDAGIRELPADDRGVEAFVLDESGWRFINTASPFYYPDLVEVKNSIKISENGSAGIGRTLVKQGSLAAAARNSLGNRLRQIAELNEYWNAAYPGSSTAELAIASMKIDEPVQYSYSISVPGCAQVVGGRIIFDTSVTKSEFYRGYAMAKNRRFPLILPGAWTTRTTTAYSLPKGFHADRIPANERYDHEKFSASFSYSYSGAIVTVETVIEIKNGRIDAEEYPYFREFTRFIDKKERERIVLAR